MFCHLWPHHPGMNSSKLPNHSFIHSFIHSQYSGTTYLCTQTITSNIFVYILWTLHPCRMIEGTMKIMVPAETQSIDHWPSLLWDWTFGKLSSVSAGLASVKADCRLQVLYSLKKLQTFEVCTFCYATSKTVCCKKNVGISHVMNRP